MTPEVWNEILEKIVKPQGRTLAVVLHELLSVKASEGMQDALDALNIEEMTTLWEDVVLPAMQREMYATLARLNSDAADGWEHVYRMGYKEHIS